jgi:hypothetical protein
MAEKIVAWWLFGHAKHYNDIAFLAGRMVQQGRRDREPDVRTLVRRLIEKKLGRNRDISANLRSGTTSYRRLVISTNSTTVKSSLFTAVAIDQW